MTGSLTCKLLCWHGWHFRFLRSVGSVQKSCPRQQRKIFQTPPTTQEMSSVLITGCSRGLGLEFCKQLLTHSNPPGTLIATCRNPDEADVSGIFELLFQQHFWYHKGLCAVLSLPHACLNFLVPRPSFLTPFLLPVPYWLPQALQALAKNHPNLHILKLGMYLSMSCCTVDHGF